MSVKMDDGVNGKHQHHHAPSRIPGPKTGRYQVKNMENGVERGDTGTKTTGNMAGKTEHKRFETFVMTGDMIIQKSSPHPKTDAIQASPTEKRKKQIKHSPVPLKKDGKSSIARPTNSPKSSPKRKAPHRAVIESPKSVPKRVVHSPPSPRKEPNSPKTSPKKDSKKSPKLSRLPRFTPKNSPKLSQKQMLSAEDVNSSSDSHTNMEQDESDVTMEVAMDVATDIISDTNGAQPPRPSYFDMQTPELELLGYPRFPDVPVELDIPPDDISSEDERYKNEGVVDIDDLPPPPEEFFNLDTVVIPDLDSQLLPEALSPEIRTLVTRTPDPILYPEPEVLPTFRILRTPEPHIHSDTHDSSYHGNTQETNCDDGTQNTNDHGNNQDISYHGNTTDTSHHDGEILDISDHDDNKLDVGNHGNTEDFEPDLIFLADSEDHAVETLGDNCSSRVPQPTTEQNAAPETANIGNIIDTVGRFPLVPEPMELLANDPSRPDPAGAASGHLVESNRIDAAEHSDPDNSEYSDCTGSGPVSLAVDHITTYVTPDGQVTSFCGSSPHDSDSFTDNNMSEESPQHHERCASVGESNAIDTSRHSINSDSKVEIYRNSPSRAIVVSKSAEKIAPSKPISSVTMPDNLLVRSSKSHENYLECNEKLTLVDIDLEENIASSVDALHYEKSSSSLDSLGYVQFQEQSRSLSNSPDKRTEKSPSDRKFMPTFISLEEARSITKLKEGAKLRDFSKGREESASSVSSSPTKGARTDDKSRPSFDKLRPSTEKSKSPQSSPSHKPSAIPVRDSRGKPPRPPVRTASNPTKTEAESVSSPTAADNHVDVETSVDNRQETTFSEPTSPIIESPLQTADSHMVHSDLPTEAEPPIATSSAPPSPSPDSETTIDMLHQCQSDPGAQMTEVEKELLLSLYHQPLKEIDRPSAARLAKRLYQLDGFKKSDITRHLSKKNDFSYLVGEEYLKFFEFTDLMLDQALRTFLKNLIITGETQERERVLAHFSRRYLESNPGRYNSEDACHTLVCALMLLNTDLHGQNIGRKMAVNEFIENLADLNDGENFPKEVLKNLYHSIRSEPLECHFEDDQDSDAASSHGQHGQDGQRYLGHNPFLDIPDPNKATEYKKGYVMRKCCMDIDGRKTPMGKRGWKMFFATLRDMVLYLHKDDHAFKKNTMVANTTNAIRIHHALAYRATDYKKKQHVLRVQTAEWAQYLFQTSNSKECQEWIDTINFVAASLSAPPLPGGCGSQKKFQRPLLPASCTRLNMREQAQHHEQKMLQAEQDLHEHRKYPPDKTTKSRFVQDYVEKESFLQFELKRYKVYSALLQMKLATFPELEPSLVEIAIGEVDEPSSHPSSPEQCRIIPLEADLSPEQNPSIISPVGPLLSPDRTSNPVQRSMSDRPDINTRLPLLSDEYSLEKSVPATAEPPTTEDMPESKPPQKQNVSCISPPLETSPSSLDPHQTSPGISPPLDIDPCSLSPRQTSPSVSPPLDKTPWMVSRHVTRQRSSSTSPPKQIPQPTPQRHHSMGGESSLHTASTATPPLRQSFAGDSRPIQIIPGVSPAGAQSKSRRSKMLYIPVQMPASLTASYETQV